MVEGRTAAAARRAARDVEEENMTRTTRISSLVALVAALALTPLAATAGEGNPELIQRLLPVYRALQADPQLQIVRDQLVAARGSREAVDAALAWLPLSPLELVRIDMHVKRYEFMIPPSVLAHHRRWVELNPELARDHYGAVYVDELLRAGWKPPVEGGEAAAKDATVGTNRNAASDFAESPDEYQGEIQVVANPSNPSQVVAGANTMKDCGDGPTQGVFYSADGGANWGFTCAPGAAAFGMTCDTMLMPIVFGSDPALWFDDQGKVYLEYMLLCGDAIMMSFGVNPGFAIVVASSANGGSTWSGQGVVVDHWATSDLEDKNLYALDRNPASPYYGRHYTCWDRGNNELFAYSANCGSTWTEVDLPAAGSGTLDLGCEIAVEDNGTVHLVFDTLTCGTDTCSNEQMFYTRSTNGGAAWSTPTLVQDFNLVSFSNANKPGAQDSRGINPFGAVEVDNSGGACDGTLYTVFSDYAAGQSADNTDIWLARSTNGGASWLAPVRVNDDGAGGKAQFHPYMMVDQSNGAVVVAWHDARNSASNHEVDYYLARSVDCGLSFEANIKASQPSAEFNNSGISTSNANTTDNANANPNQYGEYMGLDTVNGSAFLAWSDSRHFFPGSSTDAQKENLAFVRVDFPAVATSSIFADDFETGGTGLWDLSSP